MQSQIYIHYYKGPFHTRGRVELSWVGLGRVQQNTSMNAVLLTVESSWVPWTLLRARVKGIEKSWVESNPYERNGRVELSSIQEVIANQYFKSLQLRQYNRYQWMTVFFLLNFLQNFLRFWWNFIFFTFLVKPFFFTFGQNFFDWSFDETFYF